MIQSRISKYLFAPSITSQADCSVTLLHASCMTSAQFALAATLFPPLNQTSSLSTFWVTETSTTSLFPVGSSASGTQPVSPVNSASSALLPTTSSITITFPPTSPEAEKGRQTLYPSGQTDRPHVVIELLTATKTRTTIVNPSTSPALSLSKTFSMTKTWSAPARMRDLSAFNVSSFHTGKSNLAIVQGIPPSASASILPSPSAAILLNSPSQQFTAWDNDTSVLQLLYPANSINPGNQPVGGAQFYASPIEMQDARNVTLGYSAFFPEDFDFVLAGKLPGLYGGRTGCSGGDEAEDCFSTRLMWRKGGDGELYLYAPKDKQPDSLCGHPQSVCDSTYGLSIGRGSFKFARGRWTNVRQQVVLNTPGKPDGAFTLDVNGKRVIERNDIFYRDTGGKGPKKNSKKKKPGKKKPKKKPQSDPDGDLGDILDPLLDGLFGRDLGWDHVWRRDDGGFDGGFAMDNGDPEKGWLGVEVKAKVGDGGANNDRGDDIDLEGKEGEEAVKSIGFLGLFFSTFFGGHDPKYATPRDQYVWFKDFTMSYNA